MTTTVVIDEVTMIVLCGQCERRAEILFVKMERSGPDYGDDRLTSVSGNQLQMHKRNSPGESLVLVFQHLRPIANSDVELVEWETRLDKELSDVAEWLAIVRDVRRTRTGTGAGT